MDNTPINTPINMPMNTPTTDGATTTGRVVSYAAVGYFGFIECKKQKPVYFNLRDCERGYRQVHVGDNVQFAYDDNDGAPCARRVCYLGNAALDDLRTDFADGTVRQGYIKRIANDYYVRDVETHILLKLTISPNERDTNEIYRGSLNRERGYQITHLSASNSLRAVLVTRRFQPGLAEMVCGQVYEATVTHDFAGGYLLQLQGSEIKGVLPCKKVFKQLIPIPFGSRVAVTLLSSPLTTERLLFELANDSQKQFLSLPLLAARQVELLAALSPDTAVPGTVKSTLNFGAFIALDSGVDALLHINNFLPPPRPSYSRTEKQAAGDLLAELLPVGSTLWVVVTDIDGSRCSVDLDMRVACNVALKAQFAQWQQALRPVA